MTAPNLSSRDFGGVELPLLPLKDIVIFPHMIVPIFIHEDVCIQAVEQGLNYGRRIFVSALKVPGELGQGLESSFESPYDVYEMGTVCSVMRTRKLNDGRVKVLVQGIHKAKILGFKTGHPVPLVYVQEVKDSLPASTSPQMEGVLRSVRENLEKVVALGKTMSPDILMIIEDVKDPGRLSDLVASNLALKVSDSQKILSIHDPEERLAMVHAYLSREIEIYQMQLRIQNQAREEIGKLQKEHYLREQIRALKSELGDSDPKDELEELWKKIKEVPLSAEARDELSKQLRRLERMHQETSEASLLRTHVETVLALPWDLMTEDKLDLKKVGEDLDREHFGLHLAKDRILEYLAVKKLNPAAKGPILCFVGPPGVGKTSLGSSIARSIGKSFARISLGGVRDEADIRGHRKTYVGAYPGRIMHGIKQAKTMNPLIMLDEIDKLGSDYRGDPASALLEVLDPEQNHAFMDHYLGIHFDLSKVMFITNANSLDTIPPALRDRLEIIEISGYSEDEKAEIAGKFLIPKQTREAGLGDRPLAITPSALHMIIRGYTKESGLRTLEKQIASVCRKVARDLAENDEKWDPLDRSYSKVLDSFCIDPGQVLKYLGPRTYDRGEDYDDISAGVALGMAYTQVGGELLSIETNLLPGRKNLVLTGNMGDVMKESAQTAVSYIRAQAMEWGVPAERLACGFHVHIPMGAIPKDGPSAGVALVTSMLSALLGVPQRPRTCMTGEISLHGRVLPIGGLKEKVLAAQREGMRYVIIPEKNRTTFESLSPSVTQHIEAHFVSNYKEVYEFLFLRSERSLAPAIPAELADGHQFDLVS